MPYIFISCVQQAYIWRPTYKFSIYAWGYMVGLNGELMQSSSAPLVVYTWSKSKHFSAISLILSLSFISALLLELFSDAVLPFLDALVTWGWSRGHLYGCKKLLENWIYWLVTLIQFQYFCLYQEIFGRQHLLEYI